MNRLAIAALLIGLGASAAPAQQPGAGAPAQPGAGTAPPAGTGTQPGTVIAPPGSAVIPVPGAGARPLPALQYGFGGYTPPAPVVVPRPRSMFTANPNVFNYDSGDYLLGGFDGFARAQGSFTMAVPPGSRPVGCQSCQPWTIIPPQPVVVVFDVVKP